MSLRADNAEQAIRLERERLREVKGVMPWAWLLANAVLEADDRRAGIEKLVCVGDGISWLQIEAIFDLALCGHLAHQHLAHPTSLVRAGCPLCMAGEQFNQSALIDPVLKGCDVRYTDLYNLMRAEVKAQIEGLTRIER